MKKSTTEDLVPRRDPTSSNCVVVWVIDLIASFWLSKVDLASKAAAAYHGLLLTVTAKFHVLGGEERLILLIEDAAGDKLLLDMEMSPNGIELRVVLNVYTEAVEVVANVAGEKGSGDLGAVDEEEDEGADECNRDPADEEGDRLDSHPEGPFNGVGDVRVHPSEEKSDKNQGGNANLGRPGGRVVDAAVRAAGGEAAAHNMAAHCD